MRTRTTFAWIGLGLVAATVIAAAQQGTRRGEWTRYGGDPGGTKYAPLDQINKSNVSQLRIAWRRPAVDPSLSSKVPDFSYSSNFRATPLMIDGVLYSPNGIGLVEAFHPGTGKTLWVQEPFPDEPAQGLRGDSTRGVTYWTDGKERRLFVIRGEYLIALDLRTGQRVESFGEKGRVNLRLGLGPRSTTYSWTGAAQVCRDVVIVGVAMADRPQRKEQAPERCLLAFGSSSGPPMLPVAYNNHYQIVQTPGYVMILVEMVHDVRIIPTDGRAHGNMRRWLGDSVGRWEGDTFVVDSINFKPQVSFRGSSEHLHVIERFTRTDANTILYTFTIDDPTTWTRQWSGEIPLRATDARLYEYACHEANYGLEGVLRGARAQEKEKETAGQPKTKQK